MERIIGIYRLKVPTILGGDRLQVDMLENNLACLNKMSVEVTSLVDSIIKRMPFSEHTH